MVKNIYKSEGLGAFWKGNTAGILLYASYNSVQFSVYKHLLTNPTEWGSFISGGLAAFTATSITYPFDLLRTRMTISKGSRNLFQEFKSVLREKGGLFKGYILTIGQVVPYMGCIFFTHNFFAERMKLSDFWAGALAGFTCKTGFLPLDVFRKRLQLYRAEPGKFCLPASQLSYTQLSQNRLHLLQMMLKNEGISAFFRGWSMAVLKSTPVTAITFSVHKLISEMMYPPLK